MTETVAWLRPALAGSVALGCCIGFARFGFVPMFPAMVGAGWVEGAGAGLLGAANLTGYLLGALCAQRVARRIGFRPTLELAMGAAGVSLLACATPAPLLWFVIWRALAGVAGGLLMSLAGPAVQAAVAPRFRGAASGVVIAGVGAGVIVLSLVLPWLLMLGVGAGWAGLGVLTLLGWAWSRRHWPPASPPRDSAAPAVPAVQLVVAYGFSGAGMVPPMVYLADLAVRGRGLGVGMSSGVWLLFGLGGMIGTVLGGRAVDALGPSRALRLWLTAQVAALCFALWPGGGAAWLGAAAIMSGFSGVGVSAVALAALRRQAGPGAAGLWPRATAAYAAAQAATGFALAWLFAQSGQEHWPVFSAGLVFSLAALATGWRASRDG
ncbi:putative MFS family arabinose efflux permease [Humitalea rosea]|uniref:Putative MFS family arabinose efflux permease n=1 Tax=Humitalea rosea TaxID=990373 RepID=A0A2W7I282_9PROT|nr:YbfB/YjiJ family MFS transporter [Humitalea rosea]PZW41041.1 putative MFS family arabinose efflux permease [Humitalea rosea]